MTRPASRVCDNCYVKAIRVGNSAQKGFPKSTLHYPAVHPLLLCTMPLKGRQRSKIQKANTAIMGKKRWPPKSSAEAKTIDAEILRLRQEAQEEHERKMEKYKREKERYTQEAERHLREVERLRGVIAEKQRQVREAKKTNK